MNRDRDSLHHLLLAVPAAALRLRIGKLPPWLTGLTVTVCGLVLILSPLALWVAWTQTIFNVVLAIALLALLVAFAIVRFGREEQL